MARLIRKAQHRIVVIDSYVDDSVLVQLSKRKTGVTVDIYDGRISDQLRQDVERHNRQYPGVTLHAYNKAHDRFLIIDEEVYHIGHSLKDLGKSSSPSQRWMSSPARNCFPNSESRPRNNGYWLRSGAMRREAVAKMKTRMARAM